MPAFLPSKQQNKFSVQVFLVLILQLTAFGQIKYPYIKAELKTNLSKITCLDNFDLKAKQINWELQNPDERKLLFQNLNFISREKGYSLAFVPGAGDLKFFFRTSDGGRKWNYDQTIKYTYIFHMQFFGKDTIILYGKRVINYNTYEYERYRYFSNNGGESWDSIRTNLNLDISLMHFKNPQVAYCVDINNSFFSSSDGGINWEKRSEVSVGFKKELYSPQVNDLFLLSDNALYRSIDGGIKWRKIQLPYENGLSDLCLKGNIGFISGSLGRILKTEDGGDTWKIANSKLFPHLFKIEMQNKDSVYSVGNLGTVLFSSDSGRSWQQQYTDNRDNLFEIQIIDRQNIFIAGMYGLFKYYKPETLNYFQWEPQDHLISADGQQAKVNSANDIWVRTAAKNSLGESFTDSMLVDVDAPAIFISSDSVADHTSKIRLHALSDAGAWSLQNEEFGMVWYHDLELIGKDTLLVGGQHDANGVILKSTDGGSNWFHVKQNIDYRIDDMDFPTSKIGYAGGYLGYLIKTIDGGDHWEKLLSPTSRDIKSISFISENIGYLAADYGQIFKTTDGGKTWESIHLNYDWAIKILFLNEQKGFLLHNYSGFLSTVDGGKTWQEVPHDKFFDVTDLTFVNENVGYATGGMLAPFHYIKTVDGGKTWKQKIFPRWDLTTYQAISFKDEYSGFVFNLMGEVITTGDGGQNWFILDTLKFNEPNTNGSYGFYINSFQFIDEDRAIGVGNGQIIHYEFSPEIKYKWSPNTKVSGENTAHPLVPTYSVKTFTGSIYRDNNCSVSFPIDIPQINVSATELNSSDITIYPQPAHDELLIQSMYLSEYSEIRIFDMKGAVIFIKEIEWNNGLIKIKPNLVPGMYIIEINGKGKTIRKKISFQ